MIDNTLTALEHTSVQPVILTGEADGGKYAPPLPGRTLSRTVPELRYNDAGSVQSGEELGRKLIEAARKMLGKDPDLWHFHNHSLGKNPGLPAAVRMLALQGFPLLLQLHDFAEDGRAELYHRMLCTCDGEIEKLGRQLYPVADHVHYALINRRDAGFIEASGGMAQNTHVLSNPVRLEEPREPVRSPSRSGESDLILYPTRAIRRKNVGELLLWAALLRDHFRFGLTRGPKNPDHRPVYDTWKAFSEQRKLPVQFELGEQQGVDFEKLLSGAGGIITTSVAEGFGLCFMEPFLAGQPLGGRSLPEITPDFEAKGLDLSNLYEELSVPVDYVGGDALKGCIEERMHGLYGLYNRRPTPETVERALSSFIRDGMVDFGRLDEPMQETVINVLLDHPGERKDLVPDRLDFTQDRAIPHNREIIEAHFSLKRYGERLRTLYKRVAGASKSPVSSLRAESLLDIFLAPERFSLLKTAT